MYKITNNRSGQWNIKYIYSYTPLMPNAIFCNALPIENESPPSPTQSSHSSFNSSINLFSASLLSPLALLPPFPPLPPNPLLTRLYPLLEGKQRAHDEVRITNTSYATMVSAALSQKIKTLTLTLTNGDSNSAGEMVPLRNPRCPPTARSWAIAATRAAAEPCGCTRSRPQCTRRR